MSTRIPVRVLRRAERDLQTIYAYLAREAPGHADRLVDEMLDAIDTLSSFPERGSSPRDPVLRTQGFLVHRPYLIFYKSTKRLVRVYRVIHHKRAYQHLL
jgi:toxin ParE1/3/4